MNWPGYRIAGVFQSIADEALDAVRGADLVQQRHPLLHRRAVAAAEVAPKVLVVLVRAARFDLLISINLEKLTWKSLWKSIWKSI